MHSDNSDNNNVAMAMYILIHYYLLNYRILLFPTFTEWSWLSCNWSYIHNYDKACLSGAEYSAALIDFNTNVTYIDAIDNDQTNIYCTGTCLTLTKNVSMCVLM